MLYDRFTENARKVCAYARLDAIRLNHEYVGTEHFLLGLLKDESTTAVRILKKLNIDLSKVRLELKKIVMPGPEEVNKPTLFTPRAKKFFEYSLAEARNLGHTYIGTEHFLLGLLRDDAEASHVLMNLGLKPEDVRKEVITLKGSDRSGEQPTQSFQQEYWKIPKQHMSLREFLEAYKFDIKSVDEQEDVEASLYGRTGTPRPLIGKLMRHPPNIEIFYDANSQSQIEEALYLRDILDINTQSYKEKPTRQEVARQLREPAQKNLDLADRLEGC